MARIVSDKNGLHLACTCGERVIEATHQESAKKIITQLGSGDVACAKCGRSWKLCLDLGSQPGHFKEVIVSSGRHPIGTPAICLSQPVSAPEFLKHGISILAERGKQYDASGEERSMRQVVDMFNAATGQKITPEQGWGFMVCLKLVRAFRQEGKAQPDSLQDLINYGALMAEEFLSRD